MLRTGLFGLSATIAALAAGSANAMPPVGDASHCELHIWPTESLSGIPFQVGMVITGRASKDQIVGSMEGLVGPSAQLAALRDADPVRALGLPAGTHIVEHQVLDAGTVLKLPTRHAPSTSPCYSELIVVLHFLTEDIVWGDRLSSVFMFRNFGDKPEVRGSIKGAGGNKLKVLTMPEEARPANTAELVAEALKGNFLEFAKNARSKLAAGSAR